MADGPLSSVMPKEEKKYLLCRPRGGFNDTLVQMEKCRRYAKAYGRILIIDTTHSGLGHSLDMIFDFGPDFGVETLIGSVEVLQDLDEIENVRPAEIAGRISSYEVIRDQQAGLYVDDQTKAPVIFDAAREHDEQLLVYEQSGGGYVGLHTLRSLQLTERATKLVTDRLSQLPAKYDAIHVRHSDYKTAWEGLFDKSRSIFRKRSLVVCTDSFKVQQSAQNYFHSTTKVSFVTDVPETGGVPLFAADYKSPYEATVDLLTDLIALSQSDRLVFTKLSGGFDGRARWSGFSMLAYLIWREPQVILSLFKNMRSAPTNQRFRDRLERRAKRRQSYLWTLRMLPWNAQTIKRGLRWHARYKRDTITLSKIAPQYSDQT